MIFDPVCPTADFVAGEEGMRLVNVAFSRAQCRLIVMLQHGWEDNPALRFLAQQHRPLLLNADRVAELLLKKLPSSTPAKASVPITPVASRPKPNGAPLTMQDEFVAELRLKVRPGAPLASARQAAQELKDRAKYRKLTFADVDRAIAVVLVIS